MRHPSARWDSTRHDAGGAGATGLAIGSAGIFFLSKSFTIPPLQFPRGGLKLESSAPQTAGALSRRCQLSIKSILKRTVSLHLCEI